MSGPRNTDGKAFGMALEVLKVPVGHHGLTSCHKNIAVFSSQEHNIYNRQSKHTVVSWLGSEKGITTLTQPLFFCSNVYYFDFDSAGSSVRLCVDRCPNETLDDGSDFTRYYNSFGTRLCRYDVPPASYSSYDQEDICPGDVEPRSVQGRCCRTIELPIGGNRACRWVSTRKT